MKTAVQELFTKLEKEHPSLFNVHSVIGREFINDYYQFLEMEKQQIIDAFNNGCFNPNGSWRSEQYYSETFKQD
jgi:hypothetical protein